MRHSKLTLLALLLLPGSLWAQGGSKVGVVDFSRAVLESAPGREANAKFQVQVQARTQEMEQKQTEFTEAQERFTTQQNALSQTALAQRQAELQRMQRDIQRLEEDINNDLSLEQANLLGPIYESVNQIVVNYAGEQGYAVILDVATQDSPVVYFSEIADVTTEIIRRIDAAYQPEGGSTQPSTESETDPPPADPSAESPQP